MMKTVQLTKSMLSHQNNDLGHMHAPYMYMYMYMHVCE